MIASKGKVLVLRRICETAREIGILVLVFGILDEYHRATPADPARAWWVAVILGIGAAFITSGVAGEWALSLFEEDDP